MGKSTLYVPDRSSGCRRREDSVKRVSSRHYPPWGWTFRPGKESEEYRLMFSGGWSDLKRPTATAIGENDTYNVGNHWKMTQDRQRTLSGIVRSFRDAKSVDIAELVGDNNRLLVCGKCQRHAPLFQIPTTKGVEKKYLVSIRAFPVSIITNNVAWRTLFHKNKRNPPLKAKNQTFNQSINQSITTPSVPM